MVMKVHYTNIIGIVTFLVFSGHSMAAQDWDSSPHNWENSSNNWNNSSTNWKNNPGNWENSPNRYGNDRIIYDSEGDPSGYAVPKESGGMNLYDFEGNRKGYTPAR
jgi:hypothetical protein